MKTHIRIKNWIFKRDQIRTAEVTQVEVWHYQECSVGHGVLVETMDGEIAPVLANTEETSAFLADLAEFDDGQATQ